MNKPKKYFFFLFLMIGGFAFGQIVESFHCYYGYVHVVYKQGNQATVTYDTEFHYDSWNRLLKMVYPDAEVVSYNYNLGGQLESVLGEKNAKYSYIDQLGYDKFEQRIYLRYGNGTETVYNYEPQRRRLQQMQASTGKGMQDLMQNTNAERLFMNNVYGYDPMSNILKIESNAMPTLATQIGGNMVQDFGYDNLYRLKTGVGSFEGLANSNFTKLASFNVAMEYDNLHNITKKTHRNTLANSTSSLDKNYMLNYKYGEKPHQISEIAETGSTPAKHLYEFDDNGNMTKDSKNNLLWDEENRLMAVSVNGNVSSYTYGADNERVIKMVAPPSQDIHVNAQFSGKNASANQEFTVYVNPYLVTNQKAEYTKHYYIGSERILSKPGDPTTYDNEEPTRTTRAGFEVDETDKINYEELLTKANELEKKKFDSLGVEFVVSKPLKLVYNKGSNPEDRHYFHHNNHLGGVSYISDASGEITEYIVNAPSGEIVLDDRATSFQAKFNFTGKEIDEETGWTYISNRYLNNKLQVWNSVDRPLINGHYLNGNHDGGVFNSFNLSAYGYCRQSPVVMIDPDGNQYNNSVLLEPKTTFTAPSGGRYGSNNSNITTNYKFTPATAHLLSLVSNASKENITNASVEFTYVPVGGGGLTTGSSSNNGNINVMYNDPGYDTDASWAEGFLGLMSHEVGHLPQIDESGGNYNHVTGSIKEYIKFLSHDKAPKEIEAKKGRDAYNSFNKFIKETYGKNKLEKLFENKNNTQKDIIGRINQWWKNFQKTQENKTNPKENNLWYLVLLFFFSFSFSSCKRKNKMYFDIEKQELKPCDWFDDFSELDISGVSSKNKNHDLFISWDYLNNKESPPNVLNLNNLNGYNILWGLKNISFKLKPNYNYTIIKSSGGGIASKNFIIRIWTDSTGKVYKTTHPECGLESLKDE